MYVKSVTAAKEKKSLGTILTASAKPEAMEAREDVDISVGFRNGACSNTVGQQALVLARCEKMRERGAKEDVGKTVVGSGDSKAKRVVLLSVGFPFSFLILTFPSSSLIGSRLRIYESG